MPQIGNRVTEKITVLCQNDTSWMTLISTVSKGYMLLKAN